MGQQEDIPKYKTFTKTPTNLTTSTALCTNACTIIVISENLLVCHVPNPSRCTLLLIGFTIMQFCGLSRIRPTDHLPKEF